MEQLKMHSPDISQDNISKIRALFPNCITEAQDDNGKPKLAIDFDQLKQELSDSIVDGPQERYHLNWPGKRESLLTANAPIAKTLRPCREESINFDTAENLFIEGDNLDALKLLQETYLGKVKMIYIDPPYNTGKDFVYKDNFSDSTESFLSKSNQIDDDYNKLVSNPESNGRFHSDWLSMIYSRIKLAHNLLTNDGVIFISIDDGEQANLKRICEEVFGENNFVCTFMWKRKKEISSDSKNVSIQGEYVLAFAKSEETLFKTEPLSDDYVNKSYKEPTSEFPDGKWRPVPITVSKGLSGGGYNYTVTAPGGKVHDRLWAYPQKSFEKLIKAKKVYWGLDSNGVPQRVMYVHESKGQPTTNYWDNTSSNKAGKKVILDLFGDNLFDTTKPIALIQRLANLVIEDGDIVLDFFAGSSTTAHAILDLNKTLNKNIKFIMVQIPELCNEKSPAKKAGYNFISDISKERIKLIIERLFDKNTQIDAGFRVLKIDSSNMTDVYYNPDQISQADMFAQVENIKEDRNDEDLLFQVLLDWGVGLTLPISKQQLSNKDVFFVNADEEGEGADLIACFAQNITNELIKQLAELQPLRVVFRDDGFANDAVKINAEQIFKQVSPGTDVKSI